jgi:hypothetical protein
MEEREVGARSRNQASHSRLHIMYLDAGTRLSCAHFILSAHERESVSAVILARTPIHQSCRIAAQLCKLQLQVCHGAGGRGWRGADRRGRAAAAFFCFS